MGFGHTGAALELLLRVTWWSQTYLCAGRSVCGFKFDVIRLDFEDPNPYEQKFLIIPLVKILPSTLDLFLRVLSLLYQNWLEPQGLVGMDISGSLGRGLASWAA
jgi:hypothetical protein